MRCIRGCRGRTWTLLPSLDLQGIDCVQMTVQSLWLRHCLGVGRQRGQWGVIVRRLIQECINAFDSKTQATTASDHSKPSPPTSGRKRILDSDDDAELDPKGFEPRREVSKHTGRPPRQKFCSGPEKRVRRGELVTREIRGTRLTYTVSTGRKMYVPVSGSSLQSILQIIAQAESQDGMQPSADLAALLHKSDRPRLGWRAHKHESKFYGNWYMRWQAADGTSHLQQKGFQVPRMALSGDIYDIKEACEAAKQVLHRVKKQWNKQDKSDLPRFDE